MTHKIDLISYKAGADDKEKELIEEFEKMIDKLRFYNYQTKGCKRCLYIKVEEIKQQLQELKRSKKIK